MHIFDYSFLDVGNLPAEMINLTSAIAAFNAISSERKIGIRVFLLNWKRLPGFSL